MSDVRNDRFAAQKDASVFGLFGNALKDGTQLIRDEIGLMRAEVSSGISGMVAGLIMIIAGAVFGVVAITLIIEALVAWLAVVLDSEALAAIICAVIAGAVAVLLFVLGKNRMSPSALKPKRTVQNVQDDAEMVRRRVS